MGVRYRKSVKLGPVRVNLSKSGVSYSVGVKGARVTKRADGRVQTTVGVPGTGLYYTDTKKKDAAKHSANDQPKTDTKTTANTPAKTLLTLALIIGVVILLFILIDIAIAA